MRCPHCREDVPDGAATCPTCDAPLTAYSGQLTGEVSGAARARAARLSTRPPIVPVMAVVHGLVALVGPLGALVRQAMNRAPVNAESTNYIGAAFGAAGLALAAIVLLPVAILFGFAAWGTMMQRTWAWYAGLAMLGAIVLVGGMFLGGGSFMLVLRVVAAVALAALWIQPRVREWFGVQ